MGDTNKREERDGHVAPDSVGGGRYLRAQAGDPDHALYRNLLEDDGEQAVRALLPRIAGWICEHRRAVASRDVDDLAAETIERVAERVERFRGDSKFFTWVVGFARLVCLEYLRKRADNPEYFLEEMPGVSDGATEDPERTALLRLVTEEALASLTPLQRTVFQMRVNDQLTATEIGKNLKKTPGAIRSVFADAMAGIVRWRAENGYEE